MKEEIVGVIILVGILQGSLLCVGLFNRDKKLSPTIFLVILIFSYLVVLVHKYIVSTSWVMDHIIFFYLTFSTPLLIGPAFYLYIKSILNYPRPITYKDLFHLAPFLGFMIYFIFRYALGLQPASVRYQSGKIPTYVSLLGSLKAIHMTGYGIVAYFTFVSEKKRNSIRKHNKSLYLWLLVFVNAFMVTIVIGILSFVLGHYNLPLASYLDDVPIVCLVILLYVVSYYAIKNPIAFSYKPKYGGSHLKEDDLSRLHKQLIEHMESDRIFIDENLRLDSLASLMSTSTNSLSRVINEKEGKSFQDFINSYRVEALKKALLDPGNRHKKILAIGYEVGFNSKTAMNRIFKKETGLTPSDFIRSVSTTL